MAEKFIPNLNDNPDIMVISFLLKNHFEGIFNYIKTIL